VEAPPAAPIGANPGHAQEGGPKPNRLRSLIGAAVILCALGGAGFAVADQRTAFTGALRQIGVWPMVIGFVCGALGVAVTFGMWREVLRGLGVEMPWGSGARVFFTSQLGKYVPGSVWPALMQMEAGKKWGSSRRTMLAGNLITIFMNACTGLIVAGALLPVYDAKAVHRYWWALLALPFLLALLHPRAIPGLLDRALALVHRPPVGNRLDPRCVLRASAWSLVSWLGLGAQIGVLCLAVGSPDASHFVLSIGAMALAYSLGVLFVPAPAGAGVRDVVLVLVLGSVLNPGQALAVVLASRALLVGADLLLAAVAAVAGGASALQRRSNGAAGLVPDGRNRRETHR
jgi:uncharacterized membrane protein YbhN (UPF0104 family)